MIFDFVLDDLSAYFKDFKKTFLIKVKEALKSKTLEFC